MDFKDVRKMYQPPSNRFSEQDLVAKEPMRQFSQWFEEAKADKRILQANAMCLATSTKTGVPSSRMVLLKGFKEQGFEFFTNYSSRKGVELVENPRACLMFYWDPLDRQVRVEGRVEKMSADEGETYFHQRPRTSQISAAISEQSSVTTKEELIKKYEAMCAEYADETIPIPKPKTWGGFTVVPDVVEFFQGQTNRLHDRIRFRKPNVGEQPDNVRVHQGEHGWLYERLSP